MVREPTHSLCVSHREEEVRRLWFLTQRNTTIFAQVSVYSLLGKFSVARAIKIKKKITRVIHKISLVMVLFRSMKVSWRRVGIMWKSHAAKNAGTFREIVIQLCLDAPIMWTERLFSIHGLRARRICHFVRLRKRTVRVRIDGKSIRSVLSESALLSLLLCFVPPIVSLRGETRSHG